MDDYAVPASDLPKPRFDLSVLRVEIDWRVAIGQVLLTALGVVLALGASAWWGERQERVREHSELTNALNTTRETEKRLRQALLEDSISMGINQRILTAAARIPDDSMWQVVHEGIWYSDARPVVAPLAAMIQNGDIHLVRDARLRAMLPVYVGEIEARTRGMEDFTRIMVGQDAVMPAVITDTLGRPHAQVAAALRASPEVRRQAAVMEFGSRNLMSENRIMLRETTALRMELERVLGAKAIVLPPPRFHRDSF
jgi:hypothetical protein